MTSVVAYAALGIASIALTLSIGALLRVDNLDRLRDTDLARQRKEAQRRATDEHRLNTNGHR